MGFFSRFQRRPAASRSAATFTSFDDVFPPGVEQIAGVAVTKDTALTLPAVWRCVGLNAETIASLPVHCYTTAKEGGRQSYAAPRWMVNPSEGYSWFDFICEVQTSLELDGNAFILKITGSGGRVVDLMQLPPQDVTVDRVKIAGKPRLTYTVKLADGSKTYASTEMIHIRALTQPQQLRGMSPITNLALTVGTGLAAQQFGAKFFGEGATLSGVISIPTNPDQETIDKLAASFKKKHGGVSKSHAAGILVGGATWTALSVKPEEAQFLETQKFTATQIASFYGVPPEYVTEAEGAKGYVTGLYARQMLWLQTGLLPRIKRLEVAFSALLPDGVYMKFNVDGLLRADPKERAEFLGAMIEHQALTPNEWREMEERNPLAGGDTVLRSVQYTQEVMT